MWTLIVSEESDITQGLTGSTWFLVQLLLEKTSTAWHMKAWHMKAWQMTAWHMTAWQISAHLSVVSAPKTKNIFFSQIGRFRNICKPPEFC